MFITMLAICAIALALAFDFVNGFHDTANAVATVIYTKALKPKTAILLSGLMNFSGALLVGTAVAKVITKIIPHNTVSLTLVIAVLIAALIWNVATWYFGLPVSSSHCLVASLFGVGIAAGGVSGVNWNELNKVLLALLISPIAGFLGAAILSTCALRLMHGRTDARTKQIMRAAQIFSSMCVSFSHGGNDGQKTMGIITLILALAFPAAGYSMDHVPLWVMVAAALAMGLGTTIGGWRVIRTVGEKISHDQLECVHGFAAELSTAATICAASLVGAPVSTTHTLTSAVAGSTMADYGAGRLNYRMLSTIAAAWVLTLPVVAALSAGAYCTLTYERAITKTALQAARPL